MHSSKNLPLSNKNLSSKNLPLSKFDITYINRRALATRRRGLLTGAQPLSPRRSKTKPRVPDQL